MSALIKGVLAAVVSPMILYEMVGVLWVYLDGMDVQLGLTEPFKVSERFLGSMRLNFVTDMRLILQRKALLHLIDESDIKSFFPGINKVLLIPADSYFDASRYHVRGWVGVAISTFPVLSLTRVTFSGCILLFFICCCSLYGTLRTTESDLASASWLFRDGSQTKMTVFSGKVWVLQCGRKHQGQDCPADGGRRWESRAAQTRRHHHWTHLW